MVIDHAEIGRTGVAGWPGRRPAGASFPPSTCDASAHARRSDTATRARSGPGRMPSRIHQTDSRDKRPSDGGGKRLAVVAANHRRQTKFPKGAPKRREGPHGRGREHAAAGQQIAAKAITQRQGITQLGIPGPELPFEVRRPDLIRGTSRRSDDSPGDPRGAGAGAARRGRVASRYHSPY